MGFGGSRPAAPAAPPNVPRPPTMNDPAVMNARLNEQQKTRDTMRGYRATRLTRGLALLPAGTRRTLLGQ